MYGGLMDEYASVYGALSAINREFYYKRYAVILPSTAGIALTLQGWSRCWQTRKHLRKTRMP